MDRVAVQADSHLAHEAEYSDLASLSVFIDSPWSQWAEVGEWRAWRTANTEYRGQSTNETE